MKYFYAKVGKGNTLANKYLSNDSPIGMPAIPIFFDCGPGNKEEFLGNNTGKEQGRNFFWCGENIGKATIVVINEGYLYLLRPKNEVFFLKSNKNTDYLKESEYVKLLPIEILLKQSLSDVPAILSSMTANAYYYSGTFREIRDSGNIRAIQSVLKTPISEFNYEDSSDLLYCLSSIELETLVAKIFEEAGCFVPAYRGGAIKDIDIFAKNMGSKDVRLGNISIPTNSCASIQVKRKTTLKKPPVGCNYLLSVNNDSDYILDIVRNLKNTKRWLVMSLNWIPKKVLRGYNVF